MHKCVLKKATTTFFNHQLSHGLHFTFLLLNYLSHSIKSLKKRENIMKEIKGTLLRDNIEI